MSNRAERRREQKAEAKQAKQTTYNLSMDQINAMKMEVKDEAIQEAVNTAMTLLFVLPMEVLMDYYWPKTYAKKIPGFADHLIDYYQRWQDGELDMDKMKEDLWEYGNVRLEDAKRE